MRISAKPLDQPVSLADVKSHCVVDYDDDDELISRLIDAAVKKFDGPAGIGIVLFTQSWKLHLDCFPISDIKIPLWPVASITSVAYVDADGADQTVDSADYRLDANRDVAILAPVYGGSWPSTRSISGAVSIEFVAGSAIDDIPDELRLAVTQLVAHWYENREGAGGKMHEVPFGVQSVMDSYNRGIIGA